MGTPVKLLLSSPTSVTGRTFFANLSNLSTFAAAPIVLTPFVRNQQQFSEGVTFPCKKGSPRMHRPGILMCANPYTECVWEWLVQKGSVNVECKPVADTSVVLKALLMLDLSPTRNDPVYTNPCHMS